MLPVFTTTRAPYVVAACLAAVMATSASAAAQPDKPLPEVNVVAVGGVSAPLGSFATEGQWLIFYMGSPTSSASARLLDAMSKWDIGDRLSRVLVVAGQSGDPKALAEKWAEQLPGVRWVGDPKNEMAKALNVRGAPTLLGAKGQTVNWRMAGVLNDPTMLRDIVKSWTGQQ